MPLDETLIDQVDAQLANSGNPADGTDSFQLDATPQGSPATPAPGNEPAPAAPPTSQPTPGSAEETPQQLAARLRQEHPELAPYIDTVDKTWQRGMNQKMEELAQQRKAYEGIPAEHAPTLAQVFQLMQTDPQAAASWFQQVANSLTPQAPDGTPTDYQAPADQYQIPPQMQQEWELVRRAAYSYHEGQVKSEVENVFQKLATEEQLEIPATERDAVLQYALQRNLGIDDLSDVWRAKFGYSRIRQQGIVEGQTLRHLKEGNAPAQGLTVSPDTTSKSPQTIEDFVNLAFK